MAPLIGRGGSMVEPLRAPATPPCSDAASYVTGQAFAADGGFLLANPQFPESLDAPE